ncbi:MAG: OmpH family outer membrane protein [Bacteroidales bacterium]|jgi:outer membrane protein|nr:OmpH family outer membrane protein [Bacteroidales bacterium]MDD2570906.1 OmpH family outer membrane protein [Bacteroidales bacterium]MDD2812450.1 OmpH family outer membrane protein [Bacteroidales bacterium]MDD3385300.1 OmpH family outer membrane protein [Bacteroidales bacterium]MDD3811071.1 OmpH family outer membrane protein [Bacteroidales bacterium]
MKKILLIVGILLAGFTMSYGQKFAYVNTEYILGRIPAYEAAQKQLDRLSEEWQKEIEGKRAEIEKLYKEYQAERVLLTEEMRTKREETIMAREKEVVELQRNYFAPEGMLYKRRQELVKPIQDDVFNAIKTLATEGNYSVIFDSASGPTMLYTDPKLDKSDEVLEKVGIQK